jgi:hypothetical protein
MNFSTTYHPETDGETYRVNQVIEYILRMYVMDGCMLCDRVFLQQWVSVIFKHDPI